jgi:hypothetical protein
VGCLNSPLPKGLWAFVPVNRRAKYPRRLDFDRYGVRFPPLVVLAILFLFMFLSDRPKPSHDWGDAVQYWHEQ